MVHRAAIGFIDATAEDTRTMVWSRTALLHNHGIYIPGKVCVLSYKAKDLSDKERRLVRPAHKVVVTALP